jgi:hypothetical protein
MLDRKVPSLLNVELNADLNIDLNIDWNVDENVALNVEWKDITRRKRCLQV